MSDENPQNDKFDPRKRWGRLIESNQRRGFTIFPDVVIKQWASTGLDAVDLAVVLTLAMYWWSADRLPYPSPATIAKQLGLSKRTIERVAVHVGEFFRVE